MAIKFNGNDLPSFVKINKVDMSIMPTIERTTIQVDGRNGSYDFGNTFSDREIEINFTIIASDEADLIDKAREFGQWLYTEEHAPLVILDEPDKHYMAKISGDTELDQTLKIGKGSVMFVAEPFAYGNEVTYNFNPTGENVVLVDNRGGIEAFPKIHLEFVEDTTSFAIATNDEIMMFGTPEGVGDTPKDTTPFVLNDQMLSTTGWTTANTVDGGVVYGSFEVVGQGFIQKRTNQDGVLKPDYGVGSNWHGASAIKSLERPTQDFTVRARVALKASHGEQIGRIEVYLLDVNGNKIGKIGMADNRTRQAGNRAEARVGHLYSNHHYFVNSYGQAVGYFNDYGNGIMEIERIGNKWRAYYASIESGTNMHYNTWETYFVDIDDIAVEKLAQIQIHVGTVGTYEPTNLIKFHELQVYSHDELSDNEVPVIFKSGDHLDIDTETGMILKNGQPFFTDFDPSSTFIKLEKGVNGISVVPAITTNGTIKFRERWL